MYKCSCCQKSYKRMPKSMIPFEATRVYGDNSTTLVTTYYKFYILCRKCANKMAFQCFSHSRAREIDNIYRRGLIDTAKVSSDNDTVTTTEGHMEVLLYLLSYDATVDAIRESY